MTKGRRGASGNRAPLSDRNRRRADSALPAPWSWLALGLVLTAVLFVRYRFLEVPLDRDEGEYAYIAQQMLAGVPPYESGYAMKWPGIYAAYALMMACFTQSTWGIHFGFALVNLASIGLVFLISSRLLGAWRAVLTAALFALLTLDVSLQGSTAQAEHFVLLAALLGIWCLQLVEARTGQTDSAGRRPSLFGIFLAGLCFGTALVVKQHGFSFGLFGTGMSLRAGGRFVRAMGRDSPQSGVCWPWAALCRWPSFAWQ